MELSLQIVRPVPETSAKQGDAIKSGTVIRLQHMRTRKWLHSHLHASPITGNQEVCFRPYFVFMGPDNALISRLSLAMFYRDVSLLWRLSIFALYLLVNDASGLVYFRGLSFSAEVPIAWFGCLITKIMRFYNLSLRFACSLVSSLWIFWGTIHFILNMNLAMRGSCLIASSFTCLFTSGCMYSF